MHEKMPVPLVFLPFCAIANAASFKACKSQPASRRRSRSHECPLFLDIIAFNAVVTIFVRRYIYFVSESLRRCR